MGDTAYSVLELGLHANDQQVTLITTGWLDAALASRRLPNAPSTALVVTVSRAYACLL
jgi:hypothetical protein